MTLSSSRSEYPPAKNQILTMAAVDMRRVNFWLSPNYRPNTQAPLRTSIMGLLQPLTLKSTAASPNLQLLTPRGVNFNLILKATVSILKVRAR
jgi:hypothetical protein